MLDQHRIARALAGHPLGKNLVFLDTTTSSNDHASELARAGHPDGTVVLAESQTAGRGRRGSSWVAPPGSSLLLSILLRPDVPSHNYTRLTHLTALALGDAVKTLTNLNTTVKWPNDLYHNSRKLAGILVEASATDRHNHHAIVGIGLNIHTTPADLPPDLATTATSLHIATGGTPPSRESVLVELLRAFAQHYPTALHDQPFSESLTTLRTRSHLIGHPITALVDGTTITGTATDLGPEGELVITLPDGSPQRLTNADLVRRTN
ncbi:MAG: biotin--[acetyl-CoA-carboxylase] ligase [Verrucomicrobiales bacterium]|nr:biotin--[acetyl-CoA-carboxylase] ligase [Verrucomicrobiales bacterium]